MPRSNGMSRAKHCVSCGEDDPDKLEEYRKGIRTRCFSCRDAINDLMDEPPSGLTKYQTKLVNGGPRRDHIASYRCVADPANQFLGRYFYQGEFEENLNEGIMPTGSVWLNDHSNDVFEVGGPEGELQQLLKVGPKRLKRLETRFPRLRRALSNPLVC